MGFFRFRRSIRILPGVRLNIGKTGISTSVGVRGAQVTLGRGKVRTTVGLPGTGLSYTDEQRLSATPPPAPSRGWGFWRILGCVLLLLWAATTLGLLIKH
jgi:hypothetical protein